MSSFGLSGLPVFQAGHWLWQRPHSVQVVKSSQPFQEKSSILPAPRLSTSGSVFSMVSALPLETISLAAPSARRLPSSRLK